MRRSGLASQSRKRRAERNERRAVVDAATVRDGRRSAFPNLIRHGQISDAALRALPADCGGPLDPHELIPRSGWPGGHLVLSNVRMVCRSHHAWIGDWPDAAHTLGMHRFSWERYGLTTNTTEGTV